MKHPLNKPDLPKAISEEKKKRIKREFGIDSAGKKKKKTNQSFRAYA
jgi:hypothetical protein